MIRVVDVVQHYGVRPVLKQVSLEIAAGQVVVFVGPNGMGKTTLLNVMAGVLSPQRGFVEYDGLRRAVRRPMKSRFAAASSSCPTILGCRTISRAANSCMRSAGCTTWKTPG